MRSLPTFVAGGGARTYLDQHSIALPDGRRRLTCMKACDVFSFITEDDGRTYVRPAGKMNLLVRLTP